MTTRGGASTAGKDKERERALEVSSSPGCHQLSHAWEHHGSAAHPCLPGQLQAKVKELRTEKVALEKQIKVCNAARGGGTLHV